MAERGALGGNRTPNLADRSGLLYPLSYEGITKTTKTSRKDMRFFGGPTLRTTIILCTQIILSRLVISHEFRVIKRKRYS